MNQNFCDYEFEFKSTASQFECEELYKDKVSDYTNEIIIDRDRNTGFVFGHVKKEINDYRKEEFIPEPNNELNSPEVVSEHKKQEARQSEPDKIDFFIVTKIPKDTRHFLWTLNQFSSLPTNKELFSPGMYCLNSSWSKLKLVKKETGFCLYFVKSGQPPQPVPRLQNTFTFGTAGLTTENATSNKTAFSSKFDFKVLATDYKRKILADWSVTFSNSVFTPVGGCVIGEYTTNDNISLLKDILILDCQLTVTAAPVSEKQSFKPSDKLVCQSWIKLSADFKQMYQNCLNADISLTDGTDEIRANKSVLSARSPVFHEMFQHDAKEMEQNSIEITDVPMKSLKILVEFLYTGNLEVEEENLSLLDLHDLYFTADKFETLDLKSICAKLLLFKVTVDNAGEIFTWADECNDKELKSRLINFISANFEAIVDGEAWSSFVVNQTKLAAEIVKVCFKTLKKSGLF